jgi:multiple sugar transport system substrate-binding protein
MTTMRDRLNRRQFLKAVAAGASALAIAPLAGCGQSAAPASDGSTGTEPVAGAPSTGELKKVRALAWSNGPVIDENFTNRVKSFNEAHAGEVEVDLQFLPYDQYWQKIDLAYASNQPYDIYYWDVQAYGHYKKDLLMNVQPFLDTDGDLLDASKYPVHLYEPWKFDGANMYALPENLQTMVLYFNKDIFDEAGIAYPDDTWSWDNMIEASQQLKQTEGDNVTQWGLNIGDLGIWWGLQTLSWSQDDAFFDKVVEPTKFNMSSPANVLSLSFVQDLIWKDQLAPNAAQRSSVGQDVGVFESGKVALNPAGGWHVSNYGSLPFRWDMAPLPLFKGKRVVPYWMGGWVIPKASKVADGAFEYARWSADEFQPQMAKDHDWVPLSNAARASEDMLQGLPPGFKGSLDALSSAKLGDLYHRNGQQIIAEVFNPVFEQVWENRMTPEDAAKEIDDKANALLAKA